MTNTAQHITDGAALYRQDDMDASAAAILRSFALYSNDVELELRRQVAIARSTGTTWAEIGRAFGITRQAAQQRFSRSQALAGGPAA